MRQAYSRDWTEQRRLKVKRAKPKPSSRPATEAGPVLITNIVTGEVVVKEPYDRIQLNRILRQARSKA